MNLRKTRLQFGISQAELARISKLSQSHISEIELETQSPSLVSIEKISNALKIHPFILLEVEETGN